MKKKQVVYFALWAAVSIWLMCVTSSLQAAGISVLIFLIVNLRVSIEFDVKLRQVAALGDAAIKIMETQEQQITDLKNQLQEQQTAELGNQLAEVFRPNA
jgi:uncharacterized membrane protein YhiD involved in acid resistance